MAKYLLIESRDPQEASAVSEYADLARDLKGAGIEESVLLRGNAVNYLVKTQNASGIKIGDIALDPPPKIAEDIQMLKGKGIGIFAVEEDLTARAIAKDKLIAGVEIIKKSGIAKLCDDHDKVFYW